MSWRWIVYATLILGLSGAVLDAVVGSLRVLYRTQEYGLPVRSTASYFISGIYGVVAFGALTWLFYWDYIGGFWAFMIACLLWTPLAVYLAIRIFTATPSMGRDQTSIVD